MKRAIVWWGVSALLAFSAGCAVDSVSTPAPTGPSEMSLSLMLTLERDVMPQDGVSTSKLTMFARDAQALPKGSLPMRVDVLVQAPGGGWVAADFGTLSNKWPVTAADGFAHVTYQAPPKPAPSVNTDQVITLRVTPIGADYASTLARTVTLQLMRPGVIQPPTRMVPRFTFSPSSPREYDDIFFDATTSSDPDQHIVQYEWTMGNGATRSGRIMNYAYELAGTYGVVLTVRGSTGVAVSTSVTPVTVSSSPLPTALFTVSPTAPQVGQPVVFNSAGSTATPGRRIDRYDWDLGDGTFTSGVAPVHTYTKAGSFSVILVVTDDAGRKGVRTQVLAVTDPTKPTPSFTFSPSDPMPGQTVDFNATSSLPASGRRIVSYTWDFGDPSDRTPASGPMATHRFPGGFEYTYTVTLTVVDDAGNTAVLSKSVPVKFPSS